MLREELQAQPRDLRRVLDVPSRDTLRRGIRQMARDLRACEEARRPDAGEAIDRTTAVLRERPGRTPTPSELARSGGIDVEDVLDELSRRRNARAARA